VHQLLQSVVAAAGVLFVCRQLSAYQPPSVAPASHSHVKLQRLPSPGVLINQSAMQHEDHTQFARHEHRSGEHDNDHERIALPPTRSARDASSDGQTTNKIKEKSHLNKRVLSRTMTEWKRVSEKNKLPETTRKTVDYVIVYHDDETTNDEPKTGACCCRRTARKAKDEAHQVGDVWFLNHLFQTTWYLIIELHLKQLFYTVSCYCTRCNRLT